ncbi:hypothetical protein [Bilophila wadsworthia]|uniref:hypothetical protein n=1 Tax=Bilophila wadsworthia TaxID=35833 RepID=UPI00352143F6
MRIKIASGQIWNTNSADFTVENVIPDMELEDYHGKSADVDFLKDYLLRNQYPLGILSQNQAEEEAYASLFRLSHDLQKS